MSDKPTPESIARLPQWAQQHIKYLTQERDIAIRALNDHIDSQTPSSIYYDEYLCTGERTGPTNKRFYIQTNRITVRSCGVELAISCDDGKGQRDAGISLQWYDRDRSGNHIAFVPTSFQQASLIAMENMRK